MWQLNVFLFFFYTLRVGNYSDRYLLVTGCDTGFGKLLAKRLDKLGFNVFACSLTEHAQAEFRIQCSSKVIPIGLDVSRKCHTVLEDLKFRIQYRTKVCFPLPNLFRSPISVSY